MNSLLSADVHIGFTEDSMIRFVNESASEIQVCLILSHSNLEREITVTIASEEETATGNSVVM